MQAFRRFKTSLERACEVVKWNKMTRKVCSKEKNRMVEMPFFCLNMIHDYIIGMNTIDLAEYSCPMHVR